jgi:hypothetical protein bacD2_01168
MFFLDLLNQNEEEVFKKAILIFDTSALLELYFFNKTIAIEILQKTTEIFEERVFITEQILFEYLKNREKVIEKPLILYDKLMDKKSDYGYIVKIMDKIVEVEDEMNKKIDKIDGIVQTFKEICSKKDKHPFLSQEIIEKISTFVKEYSNKLKNTDIKIKERIGEIKSLASEEIKGRKEEIKKIINNDDIKDIIDKKFKKGESYTYSDLMDIMKEGEFRYSNSIPPGYEDKEKKGFQKYGDLIIWKQIIQICEKEDKDCIFISNDKKEDWDDKELSGSPRLELIKEFNEITMKMFYKYNLKDFIYKMNSYFPSFIDIKSIEIIDEYYLGKILKDDIENFSDEFLNEIRDKIVDRFIDEDYFNLDTDYEDYSIENISIIKIDRNLCKYKIEVYCLVEKTRYDYLGRNDSTKEILIPTNKINYEGFLIYDVERSFKWENDTIETINITKKLIEDNIKKHDAAIWIEDEDMEMYEEINR